MSRQARDWVWTLGSELDGLSIGARLVLIVLADLHQSAAGECHPRYRTLVERTRIPERTLRRRLEELEKAELIRRAPRLAAGRKVGVRIQLPRVPRSAGTSAPHSADDDRFLNPWRYR